MRTLGSWVTIAVGVLAAAYFATRDAQSVMVAFGGVFVAAQLLVPTLVDQRRTASSRQAVSARANTRHSGRPGMGAVAWVRLDTNRRPDPVHVLTKADGATMPVALSARSDG
jgi:hypothetical protein